MANDVEVKVGGNSTEIESAMQRTTKVVQDSMAKIRESFSQAKTTLTGGFDNIKTDGLKQAETALTELKQGASGVSKAMGLLKGSMAAFTAIMAGGSVLKASIEESKKLTGEANKLAKALGIDTTAASALNVALGDIYSSTDEFVDVSAKLSRQMRTDEEALNKMGLVTRDGSLEYRNMQDIMLDAIKVLNTYKEGTDRNLAAQTMFGKGAGEVTALLKLNTETLDAAKEKQAELGLVIGKENVEALKQYKAAMNDAGDVMSAVNKAIGDAVMPALTQLGEWFATTGPASVKVIKGAVGGLVSLFWGLKFAAEAVWNGIAYLIESVTVLITEFATVAMRALSGDWAGAKAAWDVGTEQLEEIVEKRLQNIVDSAEDTQGKLLNLFSDQTPSDVKKPKGKSYTDPKDKDKDKDESRVAGWEAALAKEKEAYAKKEALAGSFHEYSLQDEINYWAKILDQHDLTDKEKNAIEKKYYDGLGNLRKKNFEENIAALKTELDTFQNNQDERFNIASKMSIAIGQKYGWESKEFQASQQQIIQIVRQKAQQVQAIENEIAQAHQNEQLAEIDRAEDLAQIEVTLGQRTNAEMIQAQRQFEAQRYAIARQELERRIALAEAKGSDKDVVEYQKLLSEKSSLDRQYASKKRSLDSKAAQESMKDWNNFESSLASTYASGLNKMLNKTLSWKDALKGLYQEAGKSFLQEMIAKPTAALAAKQVKDLAMYAAGKAKELAISMGFMAQETAADETAAVTQAATQKAVGTASVLSNAAIAATAAMGSVAAIPLYGWAMAPEVGASTYAAGLGYLPSASGGYDIPAGVNPMTQLHEQEMVLPKPYANVIRDMADGSNASGSNTGGAAGGEASHTVNYHDHSGRLTRDQIRANAKVIADEVSKVTKRGWSST